jgi:hypothetical protein
MNTTIKIILIIGKLLLFAIIAAMLEGFFGAFGLKPMLYEMGFYFLLGRFYSDWIFRDL